MVNESTIKQARIYSGERQPLPISGGGKTVLLCTIESIWTTFSYHMKKSKWIKDSNIRPEAINLGENINSMLLTCVLTVFFFSGIYLPSGKGNKRKDKQMGLPNLKAFTQ